MAYNDLSLDGVSLRSITHNVEVVSSGIGFPGRTGENIIIPYQDGSRFIKKSLRERTISLVMWVATNNLDSLFQLFGREGLRTLSRVVHDGSIRTIQCECLNPISIPSNAGVSYFTVDLLCPDPHWYGATKQQDIPLTLASHNVTLNNAGTAASRRAVLTVAGLVDGIKVENTTTGTWVHYDGDVGGGTLIINCAAWAATLDGDNRVGLISHAGDPSFLVIAPGDNSLVITCTAVPAGSLGIVFPVPYY